MRQNTAGTYLTHNDMKQGQETNHIWTQEAGTHDTQQNPDNILS